VLDRDATKENIEKLKGFFQQAGGMNEVVLFLLSRTLGQKPGILFGHNGYQFSQPAQRGLPYEVIEDLLDGISARRKLLLRTHAIPARLTEEQTSLVAAADARRREATREATPISAG